MSVLKNKRKESCAEFLNDAYKIYVQTIEFLSRLSARYSRIMASDIASTAFEVLKYAESANAIYPANEVRVAMREEFLLKAKASLETLDVALSVCYDVLMKNPSGAFTSQSGKDVAPADAQRKLDHMAQSLGELIDIEGKMLRKVIKSDKERLKKEQKAAAENSEILNMGVFLQIVFLRRSLAVVFDCELVGAFP